MSDNLGPTCLGKLAASCGTQLRGLEKALGHVENYIKNKSLGALELGAKENSASDIMRVSKILSKVERLFADFESSGTYEEGILEDLVQPFKSESDERILLESSTALAVDTLVANFLKKNSFPRTAAKLCNNSSNHLELYRLRDFLVHEGLRKKNFSILLEWLESSPYVAVKARKAAFYDLLQARKLLRLYSEESSKSASFAIARKLVKLAPKLLDTNAFFRRALSRISLGDSDILHEFSCALENDSVNELESSFDSLFKEIFFQPPDLSPPDLEPNLEDILEAGLLGLWGLNGGDNKNSNNFSDFEEWKEVMKKNCPQIQRAKSVLVEKGGSLLKGENKSEWYAERSGKVVRISKEDIQDDEERGLRRIFA